MYDDSTPDLPGELSPDQGTPWHTNMAEVALLRALLACRYSDVCTLTADLPAETIHTPARRLIYTTLLQASREAVAAGEGDRLTAPAACVLAELQATPGPVALSALQTYLPEVLFGRPGEHPVTTASVYEIPALIGAVKRDHLMREAATYAGALAAAVADGDSSTVLYEIGRLQHLRDLADSIATPAPVQDATTERSAA